MAKYIFPAIFTPEENGMFSIRFPDLEGCYTCGDNLQDGLDMARDALAIMLVQYEDNKKTIPTPTPVNSLQLNDNEFSTLISADTIYYRRTLNNSAVKKTLTIPAWLNDAAIASGINFSQTLQDALKSQLNIL